MNKIIVTLVTQRFTVPVFPVQDRDCSARYSQDHKHKFPMIKEECVCNLFTIFESKKVYIQKLAFCPSFSVRPCP